MKRIVLFLFAIILSETAFGQFTEFIVDKEGLLYCHYTINRLNDIVDSLNTKFNSSVKKETHYSKFQTLGFAVRMERGDMESAAEDISGNISLEKFLRKYPSARHQKDVLIIRNKYIIDELTELFEIIHFDIRNGVTYSFYPDEADLESLHSGETRWIFEYQPKTAHLKGYIKALYIPGAFEAKEIPETYADMISYASCLMDTTQAKMKDNTREGWIELPANWLSLSLDSMRVLLDSLRTFNVLGTCSMDSRPRQHAFNIALLSAETANWQVFIKAHLDIMNYRFETRTGPSQLVNRNTYIRELEELKIDVPDLLLGISFRTDNAEKHHYYPSMGIVENVLYESKNKEEIEELILSIIADDALDDYNRIIFYFIFQNYIKQIQDPRTRKAYAEKLWARVALLPAHIQSQIGVKK